MATSNPYATRIPTGQVSDDPTDMLPTWTHQHIQPGHVFWYVKPLPGSTAHGWYCDPCGTYLGWNGDTVYAPWGGATEQPCTGRRTR